MDKYNELVKDGCEVCGTDKNITIDHDHSCCPGKRSCGDCVRGALCRECNWAEGALAGDIDRIMSLAAYVLKHSKERVELR